MKILLISTWFQIIWFLAVVGQESWQVLTIFVVALTLLLGMWPLYKQKKSQDILKVGSVFLMGLVIDYINKSSGLLLFYHPHFPLWLVAMWAAFSWYAYYMRPMYRRFSSKLIVILGGVAGALSYYAGVRLEAVMWPHSHLLTFFILMAEWMLICLVTIKVHNYGERYSKQNMRS